MNEISLKIKPLRYKNQGGCLFFAYAFWLWAKKEGLPLKSFEIVQIDYNDGFDFETNMKWINKKGDKVRSSHHFVWKYLQTEYDGDGQWKGRKKARGDIDTLNGLNGHVCLVEEFCVKALKEGSWNSCFDREAAMNHCELLLGINLDKLKYSFDLLI